MTKQIYIIEDDVTLNRLIADQIKGFGYEVASATSWGDAKMYLEENAPDLVILDGSLPDASGYDLIENLATEYPIIMLTAFGSVPHAVKAMRQGASDFLLKPTSSEELSMVIDRVFQTEKMNRDIRFCRRQLRKKEKIYSLGKAVVSKESEVF
ncbi:MAG: response regulator [Thiotrichales bacterium]